MPYGRCRLHVCSRSLLLTLVAVATTVLSGASTAQTQGARAEPDAPASPELSRTGVESDADFDRDLGIARLDRLTGEYVDAMRTLEDLLDRIHDEHGPWDMRNVVVLTEIAGVQRDLGNLDQALGIYNEALHVNRVNQGLHDVTQVDILDEVAQVQIELGDFESANQIQEYAFYVQQREHGQGSPAVLPGLYRLASWWRQTGNLFSARALYEQAVRIVEANFGPDDIRLVDALRGVASTYRQERYPTRPVIAPRDDDFRFSSGGPPMGGASPLYAEDSRIRLNRYGDGQAALERVVRIVDAHEGSTPREQAQTRLDLADWLLVFDKWNSAFETYGEVRALLVEAGWDETRMEDLFGQPSPLVFPLPEPPRRPGAGSRTMAMQGFVELVYEVGERGRVRTVDVVASDPEGLMDFRTRKAIRGARFRPRFDAGEPVATEGVEYRYEFVYYRSPEDVEQEPEVTSEPAAAPEAEAAEG